MPEFTTRDPAQAAFWDERFAANFTPWDQGAVPPALVRWLARAPLAAGARVLIPGCGSAYEAAFLDAAGLDVLSIDIAEAALARARAALSSDVADRVLRRADFFAFAAAPFDAIYERAFLCALPPRLWPAYAARCAALLRPGAPLAGLFFVDPAPPEPRRGPPFAMARDELDALLAPAFDCTEEEPIPPGESIAVFSGRERWMVWRRRS
ncbi:MAG: methyltransferase domain-containing protein [Pseudomonadota bacterium]